jgi:hypothetical protein
VTLGSRTTVCPTPPALALFSQLEAVNNVFWRRSLKNASRIKGGTFGRACSVDLPSFSATNLA